MAIPFLGTQRRTRLLLFSLLIAVTIFYLNYPGPSKWEAKESVIGPDLKKTGPPVKVGGYRGSTRPDNFDPPPPSVPEPDEKPNEKPIKPPSPADEAAADTPGSSRTSTSSAALPSTPPPTKQCVKFEQLQRQKPGPESKGKRAFPYVRPPYECRTFHLPAMEDLLERMKDVIRDPDLYRLFENSYPNTLDTMIKWRGYARDKDSASGEEVETDEELTYVITGDIDAMWLRDSASQIYSYLPLLERSSSPDSLASLWRGLINSHSRYIIISPYCHSFQPPPESGISPTRNGAYSQNKPMPPYDPIKVFDCKWELDSLASFLQVSSAYYRRTGDVEFFGRYQWVDAVAAAVDAAGAMRRGTYGPDGKVLPSAWTFTGWTNRGSETLTNDGLGNPVRENGMVRTGFRPSDDACIFQLLVPANMMWAKYLEEASLIMAQLPGARAANLTLAMREQALGIRRGIDRDAVVPHRDFGDIFAYEVDGFGGANLMDDSNIPSLLAMPLWNYTDSSFRLPEPEGGDNKKPRDLAAVYRNTRRFVLSDANPYFARGPVISAVGGPHLGPGKAWPMASIVAALTAFEPLAGFAGDEDVEDEVARQLGMVLDSTAGTGVIHESVSSFDANQWTRAWFGWANGLFGELVLRIAEREGKGGGLLGRSWQ